MARCDMCDDWAHLQHLVTFQNDEGHLLLKAFGVNTIA